MFASLLLGLVASCVSVNPQSRIKQNPAMYNSLSPEHKEMVQQGKICNGMTQNAVFLAWGMPDDRPLIGQKGKESFEKWVYTRLRPVMVERSYWSGFYGVGYWSHPWGGGWDTAYVPEVSATVTFEKGKVTGWESRSSRLPVPLPQSSD